VVEVSVVEDVLVDDVVEEGGGADVLGGVDVVVGASVVVDDAPMVVVTSK